MKDFAWRFALIGGFTVAGLLALWPPKEKLRLGIDLSGGTILVYQAKNLPPGVTMDQLVSALKKRADPNGVKEIPIRQIGTQRIEIILPQASNQEVEEVKKMLSDQGVLVFRILANQKHDAQVVGRALGPDGLKNPPYGYMWARIGEVSTGNNPKVAGNTIEDPKQSWTKDLYAGRTVSLTGKDSSGRETVENRTVTRNTATRLILDEAPGLKNIASYYVEFNPSEIHGGDPANPSPGDPIIREDKVAPGRTETRILCVQDRPENEVTGKSLRRVKPDYDDKFQPAVRFEFDRSGAMRFGKLTRNHLPEEGDAFKYRLAIVLDDQVMSAPNINSEIRDSGIIEGGGTGFKPNEVERLVTVLNAGSLPAVVDPTPLQEEKVGPTLGEDTIAKGVFAIWISMLVVPIFMLVYYRFAGVVAVIALVVNMILLIGTMAFMKATFSLPGLAGLALTIGMAVDANVLVFERMREEKERGAGMAQQIRNGFNRAWITIFDSHVTNFLAAVVLYLVGTEEVKGFALTMMIGMAWNLFTAVFMSRVIFEYWYSRGWLKKLTMLKMMDKTNIDFISPRYICMAASLIVIVLGLAATAARGKGMFNIDFTGGTLVTIRLNENDPTVKNVSESRRAEFVREKAMKVLPDVTVESLRVTGDKTLSRFNIRTTDQKPEHVKQSILDVFGPSLARVEMTSGEPRPIPAAPAGETPEAGAARTFAGGREYDLRFNTRSFNSTLSPDQVVSAEFVKVLEKAGITGPETRFKLREAPRPEDASAAAETGTHLILQTVLEPDVARTQLEALKTSLANNRDLLFERLTNFGGTVAGETQKYAIVATVASWLIIIAYLWWRFHSFTYGFAAVLAVVHDVLVTLGALAVSYWLAMIPGVSNFLQLDQFKIDLPIVAAFLTLIGFSVNDTIVIFDRIREIKGKTPNLTNKMVNDAINQTLSRTILTSLTAWLVVVILYLFGGEGLHGFAFALVVGFLSGTYSTVYIATPILIDFVASRPVPVKAGKQLAAAR